jgi:hypothetical protein
MIGRFQFLPDFHKILQNYSFSFLALLHHAAALLIVSAQPEAI